MYLFTQQDPYNDYFNMDINATEDTTESYDSITQDEYAGGVIDDYIESFEAEKDHKQHTIYDIVKHSNKRSKDIKIGAFARKPKKISKRKSDAELRCLHKDQVKLRRLCEYLYKYFMENHVAKNTCVGDFIRKTAVEISKFDDFEMVIYLPTGVLEVSKLYADPYIKLKCRCGTFRELIENIIL